MTPMIDVVFLLIIFFVVSSHLARQENQLPLPLPEARSGRLAESDQRRVVLNLLTSGEISLAGRIVAPEELTARLAHERQGTSRLPEVRIRCDRHAPFSQIQPILRAVHEAGLRDITFAVTQRKGG